MIFGQLASVARLFVQFHAGTIKLLWDFWPPLLEQPIKFVLTSIKKLVLQIMFHFYLLRLIKFRKENARKVCQITWPCL